MPGSYERYDAPQLLAGYILFSMSTVFDHGLTASKVNVPCFLLSPLIRCDSCQCAMHISHQQLSYIHLLHPLISLSLDK